MDLQKRTIIFIIIGLFIFFLPPSLCLFFYKSKLVFLPHLFINEWLKFIGAIVQTALGFFLIYIYWNSARNKNEVGREILKISFFIRKLESEINHVDGCIRNVSMGEKLSPSDFENDKILGIISVIEQSNNRISKEAISQELHQLSIILDSTCSDVKLFVEALSGVGIRDIQENSSKLKK